MASFRIPFLAAALLFIGGFSASASYELSHPLPSATRAANAISPDQRHLVATLSGAAPQMTLKVLRQESRTAAESWTELASIAAGPATAYQFRLKSGKSTVWLAWQGHPANDGIFIRRILPDPGPTEMVTGSEGQSTGFDLAIDDQERPCLISYSGTAANTEGSPFIRVHRRLSAASWEHMITVYYDLEDGLRRPEAVAIAVRGDKLHLFDLNWAQVTYPGGAIRRVSNLYHTVLETTGPLSESTFGDYLVTAASTGAEEGLQPAISGLSAAVDASGNPAIAFTLPPLGQTQFAQFSPASPSQPWDAVTLVQPNGLITGTFAESPSLVFDATNRPHLAWQASAAGSLVRSVRNGFTWGNPVVEGPQILAPTFVFDGSGNAHFAGTETGGGALAARPLSITDHDGNGFTNLEEAAFVMSGPSGRANAPATGIVTLGDLRYPAITYHRPAGGPSTDANPFSHPDYAYLIQRSADLATWTSAGTDLIHHETLDETGAVRSTWRSSVPLETEPRQFFRIRVSNGN